MRLRELSEVTDVSVALIKYYLLRRFELATDASIFDHLLAHTLADAVDEVATVDAATGRSAQLGHVVIGTVARGPSVDFSRGS